MGPSELSLWALKWGLVEAPVSRKPSMTTLQGWDQWGLYVTVPRGRPGSAMTPSSGSEYWAVLGKSPPSGPQVLSWPSGVTEHGWEAVVASDPMDQQV